LIKPLENNVSADIDVERDAAVVVIDAASSDDVVKDAPLGVGDPPIEHVKAADLGMPPHPEAAADRFQVLGAPVGAGKQHDRADPGQLLPAALVQHPLQESLEDQAAWLWLTIAMSGASFSTVAYSVAKTWAMSS
jgi:hypothetical protein